MAKKSDRWSELVGKEQWGNVLDGYFLRPEHVTRLLRRQHAAFVRLVRKRVAVSMGWVYEGWVPGYRRACEDILDALAKQKGGGHGNTRKHPH